MATIEENINRLKSAKANIKSAIISKGVEVDDSLTIDAYAEKISNIVVNQYTGDTISVGDYGMKFAYATWESIPSFLSFSNAWDWEGMFYRCQNLKEAEVNISRAMVCFSTFCECSKLQKVVLNSDNSDIYIADTISMFNGCTSLSSLTINGEWASVTQTYTMFAGCSSLTDLNGSAIWYASVDLSPCPLTVASLLNMLNWLNDFTSPFSREMEEYQGTLTLGSTNLAKLTDEQKAIATAKGWTLA